MRFCFGQELALREEACVDKERGLQFLEVQLEETVTTTQTSAVTCCVFSQSSASAFAFPLHPYFTPSVSPLGLLRSNNIWLHSKRVGSQLWNVRRRLSSIDERVHWV
eukprot:COSAG05_NODE_91_length_19902_cov_59.347523_3_plen_107_part_00